MIKIEHPVFPSPEQMDFIIEGMRNPMDSHKLSDSFKCTDTNACQDCPSNGGDRCRSFSPIGGMTLGDKDFALMGKLAKAGSDHRKYLRMMQVGVRITAPLYFYKELDTYKVGTVCNSCSTMHKIQAKEFTLDDFSCEHLYFNPILCNIEHTIKLLNEWRVLFNYTDEQRKDYFEQNGHPRVLTKKECWWQMIQLLPSSYNQTRNYTFTYENLINIYFARRNHKLDEWRIFCQWMLDNVPYFKELVDYIEKGDNKVSKGIKFSYVGKDEKVKSLKEFFSAEGFKVPDEELAAMTVELPKRATKGSAGYDCYSPIGFCLEPGQEIKLPTLLKAYMPQDIFLGAYPRSGLGFKYYARLANTVGIVDSDYADNEGNEGHIFVKIRNEGDKPLSINPGDGICQFIFQKYFTTEDDEAEGTREGGFGSTDK